MKHFRQQKRPRRSAIISGKKEVIDAIMSGKALERIYVDKKRAGEWLAPLRQVAATHLVPVNYVPVEKLNSFHVDHDGCLAILSPIHYYELQQIISQVVESGETPMFLILDGITDIRNIGGMARTAFCTGVHALIIPEKGVGSLNEDAILTSAGALEQLPVCRVGSLMKAVDELHLNGIRVFASEMNAEKKVFDLDFTEPVAIVMGSEEKGIYPALMKICDEKFSIPMTGNFESLNVSVATGMILYEAMKQRLPVV